MDFLIFVALLQLNENELSQTNNHFVLRYTSHISSDIQSEVLLFRRIFDMNFQVDAVSVKKIYSHLLNLRLYVYDVFPLFLTVCHIFLSLLASVASNNSRGASMS